VQELDGIALSYGRLDLEIKPTTDGEDYKLVARVKRKPVKKRTPPIVANPKEKIPFIVEELIEGILSIKSGKSETPTRSFFELLAQWYPEAMLFDVLSAVKADYRGRIRKSPVRVFIAELHTEVHRRNKEWVGQCKGKDCPYKGKLPLFDKKTTDLQ